MSTVSQSAPVRIGHGYDIHRFDALPPRGKGRPFKLGGIEIRATIGVVGKSDADALFHATTDAIIGAAGLGGTFDLRAIIGELPSDTKSLAQTREAIRLASSLGWSISNVDSTIILEKPAIARQCRSIAANAAKLLSLDHETFNVKVKSAEGIDSIGRCCAFAVHVVVLLVRSRNFQ